MIFMMINLLMVSPSSGNSNENLTIALDLNIIEALGLGKRFHIDQYVSCFDKSIIV